MRQRKIMILSRQEHTLLMHDVPRLPLQGRNRITLCHCSSMPLIKSFLLRTFSEYIWILSPISFLNKIVAMGETGGTNLPEP